MKLQSITIGDNSPKIVNAIIEISKGTYNKYEYDETLEVIKLDRVLHSPLFYPVDYGFIPETRAEDGDHLDIIVLTDSPTVPGCLLEAIPLGYLNMTDDKGRDEKILAIPLKNPSDVEPNLLKELEHFFQEYKKLENKSVNVEGWKTQEEAYKIILNSHTLYQKTFLPK